MHPIAILGLGLLLGLRHAMEPDHVIAVTTLASRTRRVRPAMGLGIVWGIGHTLTLFVVGSAIIVLQWSVPARIGLAMEMGVAVALMVVGLLNFARPSHPHPTFEGSRQLVIRTLLVGLVHGLAGSAAVALLVVASVREPWWACGYLVVFGVGTLLGMAIVAAGFALPVTTATRHWTGAGRMLQLSTGMISLVFGAWLVYSIGWHDGLFRTVVTWTPR